uniref:C-type lectin domain-containing protein n=1 Tax=Gallus gallus TaxID=9031 RepID=A0A8V0XXD2_CHICK
MGLWNSCCRHRRHEAAVCSAWPVRRSVCRGVATGKSAAGADCYKNGDSTAPLGSPSQCLTALSVQRGFLISNLTLPRFNPRPFPLVLSAVSSEKRPSRSHRNHLSGSGCSKLRQNRRCVLCVAVLCILVLALVAVIVLQRPSCPPPPPFSHVCPNAWVGFQGKCYYFSYTKSDWNSSREQCHRLGASLATVDTEEEMGFILQYHSPEDHWIGLHRAEGDEHWTWADGSAFSNWFELRGGGQCVYLNGDRINSTLCHSEKFWVCSRADSYVLWWKGTNPQ